MRLWEPHTHYRTSLSNLPCALTLSTLGTSVVTFTLTLTVPSLVIYQAATAAGWSMRQTGSWFFAIFVAGGLMQLVLALGYRQPIGAGVSTVATAFLVHALPGVSPEEAVGAYLLCGGLMIALAWSGILDQLMRAIPQEIVFGMLAGALLRFETGIMPELTHAPLHIGAIIAAWLLAHRLWRDVVPPVAVALAVGLLISALGSDPLHPHLTFEITRPVFIRPQLTQHAFFSLSVPLLMLVLSQNASAMGTLWAHGYCLPVRAITFCTGVFSLLSACLGAQGVSMAAARSAVAGEPSAHANPNLRYGVMVIDAVMMLASAVWVTTLVSLFARLPLGMIRVIAGLALLPIVRHALVCAVANDRYRCGGFIALAVAASDVSWLGLNAVFWSLVIAPLLSWVLDR